MTHADGSLQAASSARTASTPGPRLEAWMVVLVTVVALVPYLTTVTFPFVYDDHSVIVANAALHGPAGLLAAWALPYWPPEIAGPCGLYRPVVQFAYALLWLVGAGRPGVFHVWALLLHGGASVAVLLLLRRALAPRIALVAACLFAAHPVHVEAVASIVGSAEALVTLLACGFVALLWRTEARTPDDVAYGWPSALALALLYAAALGAKESAATIPAIGVVALWGWRTCATGSDSDASLGTVVRRGWRVWTACTIALVVLMVARERVLGTLTPPAGAIADGLAGVDTSTRLWTMVASWPTVGALLFWPAHLMMHYGPSAIPPHTRPDLGVLAAAFAVAFGAVVAGAMAHRGDRRPAAALLWIALGYLPSSNLLVATGQLLAERTLYLPSVGAVMLISWCIAAASERLERTDRNQKRVMVALASAVCLVAIIRTASYASAWRADPVLFRSGIAADPHAFHPRIQLARWYGRHGQEAQALAEMDSAYRLAPAKEDLAFEYATHLLRDQRGAEALAVLHDASVANATSTRLRLTYLATLLRVRGPRAVIDDVRAHGSRDAGGPLRFVILGQAFDRLRLSDSSVTAYAEAAREVPADVSVRILLARALARCGRYGEARAELDTADAMGAEAVPDAAALRAEIPAR